MKQKTHQFYLSLLNRNNDRTPFGLLLYFLTFLSGIYSRIMVLRARHKKRLPVTLFKSSLLSVGNITLGGTGKTPLTAWLAAYLDSRGKKCGIVLRGYGRKIKNPKPLILGIDHAQDSEVDFFGDEALLLRELAPLARIAVCANRVLAIQRLEEECGSEFIILDDGFQQVHLPKILDIVCLDPQRPFGNGYVFPRGNLREPLSAFKRATHFVFCKGTPRKRNLAKIQEIAGERPVFTCEYTITGAYNIQDPLSVVDIHYLRGKNPLILSGIGNPESLKYSLDSLEIYGVHAAYPDHFEFDQKALEQIRKRIEDSKHPFILTTEKDSVKLKGFDFKVPCYVIETELKPEEDFLKEVDKLLSMG